MLVLVADDDPGTCDLVSAVARKGGHKTIIARDASQALVMVARDLPDIIILDLHMPGGTGLGALRKLKMSAKTESIPVIVVSGEKDENMIDEVMAAGAVEYLIKPINVGDLTDIMRQIARARARLAGG